MSYLNRMYGGKPTPPPESTKNSNRVLGGLRGQGADHYSILGEDGVERSVPTQKYVQSLEQKIREQDTRMSVIEKRLRSLSNEQRNIAIGQRVAIQASRRTDDL
jgi:hypothetical protein